MPRNVVEPEIAERNRSEGEGGYTFNAFPPEDHEGFVLVIGCVRIGDHAHLDVESGRQINGGDGRARLRRSHAGRLVFPWNEWLLLRAMFEATPWVRIAEVERPTIGQAERGAAR